MNGIRSKTPASPPPQIQGQQQPRSINQYPFVGEDSYPTFQLPHSQPQQQFGIPNYDVNKSFAAPRMPSPGLGQQPTTTMYQPHQPQQGMRGSGAPFFQGNQPGMRQHFTANMQGPQNQAQWGPYMVMQYPGQHANQHQIIVNSMMPQQRMPAQGYNPGSNMQPSQQPGMYPMHQTGVTYTQGFNNPPVYFNQNAAQNRPPSASGQPSMMPGKKVSKAIKIVDPTTGKDVMLGSQPAETTSRSTPSSIAGSEVPPVTTRATNEIAAQFAEQVAKAIYDHPEAPGDAAKQYQPPPHSTAAQFAEQVAKAIHDHPSAPGEAAKPYQPPPHSTPSPQQQHHHHQHPPKQMQQIPQSMGPPPPHQNVQSSPVIMSSSLPNDVHGNHQVMEGQRMPLQHPAQHVIQQSVPPVQSVPVNVPVNSNRLQGHMDVPEVPQTSNSMHGVENHSLAAGESIEQPASSTATDVSAQSQSLSNGSSLSQQNPVHNVTVQQSVPAAENVKPSDTNTQKPPSAVQEVNPSKNAPPPVKESEASQSLSRGEPVTVSVAKPVAERTADDSGSSDSAKTLPNTKRESTTPEVHIMPPTPVEKESKVELEAPPTKEQDTAEAAQEVTVPKKEKAKKRAKELNKKGEKMTGSEFDAYVDNKEEVTEPKAIVSDRLSPESAAEVTQEPEPEIIPVSKEDSPVNAVSSDSQSAVDEPVEDVGIPKTEIQIEDVDGSTTAVDEGSQEEIDKEEEDDEDRASEEVIEDRMLKYKYCEDQWSPLNPEGKKHYDREFLLQFQFDSAATLKPEGLPDIPDIILDKPLNVGRQYNRDLNVGGSGHSSFDFTPNYVWQTGGQGGGGRQSKGMPRQPSSQKNKGQGGPPRQINVSISKDIELHRAKDAWKPAVKDSKKEQDDSEDLYKKTRSILNKLTPQKFQTLVSQMQALPIDSETKLKGVIDLVFEKAISEPNFSVAYANMCRCLSMFKVASESKPREMVNFRAVLLTRCQREFEKDKSSEALFKEKREEISKAEPGKKEELEQELEYEEYKAKRRSLGNIRFIGELFKLKMLTENIMHDCVFKLLRTKDPESLECLCRLLTTIGKELDVDKAKPRMDQYFQQMQKIVNEKKTSSRVRFMLQDVIDLRLNKWVPRRVDNNPKTIDQIHKEVEQEAQEKALLAQQAQLAPKSQPRGGQGGRRAPQGPMGGGSDGWNTVGGSRTPLRNVDRSIDPTKIKFSKQNVDESIQLGPGGGASRFAGWGRGSTGGTTGRPSQEKEKPNAPANRFSVLNKPEEDSSRRYGGTSPARGDSKGRGGFGRPPSLATRHSQELEREKALSAAKAIGSRASAEGPSRERSRGREVDRPEEKPAAVTPAAPAVKELTAEEMEKKTKSILDEFLHIQDLKEAMLCVKELSPNNHHHFVYNAFNHVIERSTVARRQTGHLLHDLVKEKIITSESYLKGLVEVLEFAEDMEIDIPKIWQYYGELISPMIQDGSVPLSFLKDVCQPLIANNKAGILLAEVLRDASHREGHKKVSGLWVSSGLQWSDFVPKNQVEQFLIEQDLEFTKGGDSAPTTPTTGLPLQEIADKLHLLIVVQNKDNEKVFDWIESNVDEPTTKKPKFIRALMTAVCNSAIKGEKGKERVDPKEITARNDLLQKYLDHQAESELQALYALQALVTKLEHPPGVLRQMFDTLYDEDIISEDAFIQWEKSEQEPEGKGAALKQVVQFFTWLRETEDDS